MIYKEYKLTNKNGYIVKVLNFGGIIKEIIMPDNKGKFDNIVLSYEKKSDYINNQSYFGAIIGRTGGRINKGKFILNNKEYYIPIKDRGNALHGGITGLDKRIWNVKEIKNGLKLTYFSPDNEEGYPGNVNFQVKYILTDNNELEILYKATTDEDTLINLTNHSYFSFNNRKNILDQELFVNSDVYFELDKTSIPTGVLLDVENTPFDFRTPKLIGKDIKSSNVQITATEGYDHPWKLNKTDVENVTLFDKNTGRKVSINSDQNSVIIYTYNFPENNEDKNIGIAIEFQNDPDGINHENFESSILKKGDTYKQRTIYKFEVIGN